MVREREIRITQGPGGAAIFFLFNRNAINNRSKKCLKNESDRLPKGNLRLQGETF